MTKPIFCFISALFLIECSFAQIPTDKSNPDNNTKVVYRDVQTNNPIFITSDNILLTKSQGVRLLDDRKKIKTMNVLTSDNASHLFGELGKYGVIIIELKDTTIESENLLELIKSSHPDKNIKISDLSINGIQANDDKLKWPKWEKLILDFDTNKNSYNILIE